MFQCKYCGKEYRDAGNCRKHEKYVHENDIKLKECQYCGKEFAPGCITIHERACTLNPGIIAKKEAEKTARKSKNEDVAGNCKFCGKSCHNQNSLRNHERLCPQNPDRQLNDIFKKGHFGYRKGMSSWNKGLTKETDDRVADISAKVSKAMKGKSTGKASTPEKEQLRRKKLSEWAKRSGLGGLTRGSGRGKKGWYKSFFCDSTYELVYVIYNIDNNVDFKRCDRKYPYTLDEVSHYYYPDFELPDGSLVEIKGYHTDLVDLKMSAVTDRPIKVLYEKDLQYAFDWVKEHYTYENLHDLYE